MEELTIELGNDQKMVSRLTKNENEKEIITGNLRRLKQRVRIPKEKIRQDKDKVKLGEKMLEPFDHNPDPGCQKRRQRYQ